jgi:prepilin-type N-terminal cleavage/methylation domain-containing protein
MIFKSPRHSGFTLLEVLAVLAILGILVAVGVPSFLQFQRRLELDQAIKTLESAFRTARGSAAESRVGATWVVYVIEDPALNNQVVARVEPVFDDGDPAPPTDPTPPRRYELGSNILLINNNFTDFAECPAAECAAFNSSGEARAPAAPDDEGAFVTGTVTIGVKGIDPTVDNRCITLSNALGSYRVRSNC